MELDSDVKYCVYSGGWYWNIDIWYDIDILGTDIGCIDIFDTI